MEEYPKLRLLTPRWTRVEGQEVLVLQDPLRLNENDDSQHAIIAANFAYVVGSLVQPIIVDIQHSHSGPGPYQRLCHVAPESYWAASASDNRYFSF